VDELASLSFKFVAWNEGIGTTEDRDAMHGDPDVSDDEIDSEGPRGKHLPQCND
jgi:hypothetical protein